MKIQIQRIEPTTHEYDLPERWAGTDPDAPMWTIEELGPVDAVAPGPRAQDRRLWLSIAAATGIAVLGFVGPAAPGGGRGSSAVLEPSNPSSPLVVASAAPASAVGIAPLTLTNPADGAVVEGAVVEVDAVADSRLGTIELAVLLDGVVSGWVTEDVQGAGPVHASIPVFAPPVTVKAELVGAVLGAGGAVLRTVAALEKSAIVRRQVSLHPRGAIGLWPATVKVVGGRPIVTVTGCAPLNVGRLQVRLVTNAGRLLAKSSAIVARDDTRVGFLGGYALGLGSFETQLKPAGTVPAGPVRIEVDWRDAIGGSWGTSVTSIVVSGSPPPPATAYGVR